MAQRVRIPHRGAMSFVCHTTPHSGSTSRRVSYSVTATILHFSSNVNSLGKIRFIR